MTSSSAAAQDRGGQLKTPSSSWQELGLSEPNPGQGPSILKCSHTVQRHNRCSWAARAPPQQLGPKWRLCVLLRHSAAPRLLYPGKSLSPSLGSQELCLLHPRCRTIQGRLCLPLCCLPPLYQDLGPAGSPPLLHPVQQQQLLDFTVVLSAMGAAASS